jgi:hypothetical protein
LQEYVGVNREALRKYDHSDRSYGKGNGRIMLQLVLA